jgi:hypothetical protein
MLFSKADTFYHAVTDTVLATENLISFSVNKAYKSYHWEIGSDPRSWEDDEVRLRFQAYLGTINITLIGENKENACFSGKATFDTLKATLTVIPLEEARVIGSYFGYDQNNQNDTFTVSVWIDDTTNEGSKYYKIAIPGICEDPGMFGGAATIGYKSAAFDAFYRTIGGCPAFEAMIRLDPVDKNSMSMQYRFTPTRNPEDSPGPVQTFIGTRIQ